MDMSGSEKRDNLKSQLTYFCSGFSVCGLLATIVIVLKRRIKNKDEDESGKSEQNINSVIICFLCISLIIVNILVVTTMDKTDFKVKNTKGSNFYL
jgi:heme/copper-type cytochrome/quinol oxidase subunit 2